MRWLLASLAVLVAILAAVISGGFLAILYDQSAGDRRSAGLDRFASRSAESLTDILSGEPAIGSAQMYIGASQNQLPDWMQRAPGSFYVQLMGSPQTLSQDVATRTGSIMQLCDSLPEWRRTRYLPRGGFSVAKGYETFLTALEPIDTRLEASEQQASLRSLLNKVRSSLNLGDQEQLNSEDAATLVEAKESLKKSLNAYKKIAKSRGYSTIGPAEYLWQLWNDGNNRTIINNGFASTVKVCTVPGLDEWLSNGLQRPVDSGDKRLIKTFAIDAGNTEIIPIVISGHTPDPEHTQLQMRRLKLFWFSRPGWFRPEAIRLYARRGKYRSQSIADPDEQLWGPSGVFNLLPVAILVLDSPLVILKLKQPEAAKLAQWTLAIGANDGIKIAGVTATMNDGKLKISYSESVNDSSAPLLARDPLIVGVISWKLPSTSVFGNH